MCQAATSESELPRTPCLRSSVEPCTTSSGDEGTICLTGISGCLPTKTSTTLHTQKKTAGEDGENDGPYDSAR